MYWILFVFVYSVAFWAYGRVQLRDGVKFGVQRGFLAGYELGRVHGAREQLKMLDPKHQYKLWLEAQEAEEREKKKAKGGWVS